MILTGLEAMYVIGTFGENLCGCVPSPLYPSLFTFHLPLAPSGIDLNSFTLLQSAAYPIDPLFLGGAGEGSDYLPVEDIPRYHVPLSMTICDGGHIIALFDTFRRTSFLLGVMKSILDSTTIGTIHDNPATTFSLTIDKSSGEPKSVSDDDLYPQFAPSPVLGALSGARINGQIGDPYFTYGTLSDIPHASELDAGIVMENCLVESYSGIIQEFRSEYDRLATFASSLSKKDDIVITGRTIPGQSVLQDRLSFSCSSMTKNQSLQLINETGEFSDQFDYRTLPELNSIVNIMPVVLVSNYAVIDTLPSDLGDAHLFTSQMLDFTTVFYVVNKEATKTINLELVGTLYKSPECRWDDVNTGMVRPFISVNNINSHERYVFDLEPYLVSDMQAKYKSGFSPNTWSFVFSFPVDIPTGVFRVQLELPIHIDKHFTISGRDALVAYGQLYVVEADVAVSIDGELFSTEIRHAKETVPIIP